jgi:2-polyprenyl-6-methoxyphenol hydroxylase-like FAD-dependent oxidoreductase
VKIACVGAGPAGLYFSILMKLRDPGHDITVFERSEATSAAGWGVTFGPILLGDLHAHDAASAREIEEAAFRWRDQIAHIRGEQLVAVGHGTYNITRQRLLDILAARARELGVRVEYGHEVAGLSQLPAADLILASDGVSSRTRRDSGGFQTEEHAGRNKYIWLGSDKVFHDFNFLFVPTSSGWIWAHAYGIDSSTSTFIVECTPETWARLGFDKLSTDEALVVLEGLFKEHLDGHRLIGELGDGSKARWLNFRTISNRTWHSGNVALIGDSAHTAHFAIGMGTTLAVGDAIVLAESLHQHDDLELALRSYGERRQAEMQATLTDAGCSARWFENITRYIELKPRRFELLLYARRSPIIAVLPPVVSYALYRTARRIRGMEGVRGHISSLAKAAYGRRKPAAKQPDASRPAETPAPALSRRK